MATAGFDPGPPAAIATICGHCPSPSTPNAFWTAWQPIFYRGRLDGSARLLCIASDPGPTERIAHRTLVGDGQPHQPLRALRQNAVSDEQQMPQQRL